MPNTRTNFAVALATAFDGGRIYREGWRSKFDLVVDELPLAETVPLLFRDPGPGRGPVLPWPPTESDLFAEDWLCDSGNLVNPRQTHPHGFAAVFGELLRSPVAWSMVRAPWPPGMYVRRSSILMGEAGEPLDVLLLRFTTGRDAIWRPAPQDLAAVDWSICAEPVPY
jgi:hypothetical protein